MSLQLNGTAGVTYNDGSNQPAAASPYGLKNLIINGNFNVWQRSTNSGPVGGSGYWAADRWWSSIGASSTSMTLSQQTFTAGQTDVPYEPTYFHRYTQTGTSTGAGNFHQRIEDVRTAAGQTVTLSFYAKASTAITINTWANQNFGSGGSTTVSTSATPHSVTTSWQKFTHTINIPSISGKTIGSSSYVRIYFGTPIGAGFDFDLAQVQLELGDTATPFENRSYGTELALCQRYYEKSYNTETAVPTATDTGSYMFLANRNPGLPHTVLVYKTTKRTTPTVQLYNSQTNATGQMKNLDTAGNQAAAASRIGANFATLYSTVSTNLGQFLQFHYTVDAEL